MYPFSETQKGGCTKNKLKKKLRFFFFFGFRSFVHKSYRTGFIFLHFELFKSVVVYRAPLVTQYHFGPTY